MSDTFANFGTSVTIINMLAVLGDADSHEVAVEPARELGLQKDEEPVASLIEEIRTQVKTFLDTCSKQDDPGSNEALVMLKKRGGSRTRVRVRKPQQQWHQNVESIVPQAERTLIDKMLWKAYIAHEAQAGDFHNFSMWWYNNFYLSSGFSDPRIGPISLETSLFAVEDYGPTVAESANKQTHELVKHKAAEAKATQVTMAKGKEQAPPSAERRRSACVRVNADGRSLLCRKCNNAALDTFIVWDVVGRAEKQCWVHQSEMNHQYAHAKRSVYTCRLWIGTSAWKNHNKTFNVPENITDSFQ